MDEKDIIIYITTKGGRATIQDIAAFFNTSDETIRLLVDKLMADGAKIKLEGKNEAYFENYNNDLNFNDICYFLDSNDYNVEVFDKISSTSTYIKENINKLTSGYVCVGKSQTLGHGRHNRDFYCYDGGLYFSLLIDNSFCKRLNLHKDATFITALSACALVDAIETVTGIDCDIKWVNDLYLNNKKVAGILAEAVSANGKLNHYILGIGINVHSVDFPDDIKDRATYLSDVNENRSAILAAFLQIFKYYLCCWKKKHIINRYDSLLFIKNKKVLIHNLYDNSEYEAFVVGVNKKLELIVDVGGKKKTLNNEEVRLKIEE